MGKYKVITERGNELYVNGDGKPEAYENAKKLLKERFGSNERIIAVLPYDMEALRECLY